MRKLPLLLVLLLLSVLLAATSAHASLLPLPGQAEPFLATGEEEGESEEEEDEEGEESECVVETEADAEVCAEIAEEERESEEAERCVLESASASVSASPSSGKVRLTVRYTTSGSAPFSLSYSLRGSKGSLRLGSAKARFGRAGAFHDVVRVNDRKLPKVLAAREFQIELQAQKTPGSCRERLVVQRRGAGRTHWS